MIHELRNNQSVVEVLRGLEKEFVLEKGVGKEFEISTLRLEKEI